MSNSIIEPQKSIPIYGTYDVVVVGGGLTGIIAAVAAAKNGSKTILIESKAFLGGVGTMGLPLQGFFDVDNSKIISGIPDEFLARMKQRNAVSDFIQCEMHNPFVIIDPEMVKLVSQEMILENGVDLLLHTLATDVMIENGVIKGLFIENKSGRQFIEGKIFIDSSGDGDVAYRAGASFTIGRETDERTQASTLVFQLDNVDVQKLVLEVLRYPDKYDISPILPRKQFLYNTKHIMVGLKLLIQKAQKDGIVGIPWDRVCYITSLHPNCVHINMVHTDGKFAADGKELTEIEVDGRSQIPVIHKVLREYVPGFENSIYTQSAAWTGIRETRHIIGEYVLSASDVEEGKIPESSVVIGGYPIDIHAQANGNEEESLDFRKIRPFGIPYGCLLPKGILNLLVAGRCISATQRSMASARVMATCMGMGQAAGLSASLALHLNCYPKDLEIEKIRETIKLNGGYII